MLLEIYFAAIIIFLASLSILYHCECLFRSQHTTLIFQ